MYLVVFLKIIISLEYNSNHNSTCHLAFNFKCHVVVRGQDWQIINSKNKNRILGKNIFSKKSFLYGEKENFEEYSLYLESAEFNFATLINYSTGKCRTCPRSTIPILHSPLHSNVFRIH
jgi:hypothetical protein